MTAPLKDLSRLCVHTFTTKPLSLGECIDKYTKHGVPAITVWRDAIEPVGKEEAGRMLRESGLKVVSTCRGGYFPAVDEKGRQEAIRTNKEIVDEAHAVGAPVVVLVCGAVPGVSLDEARRHIADGIAAVADHAAQAGVKLGIEPLHPMYADTRSAINMLKTANDVADLVNHPNVGVTLDVYHLWWEPNLREEIMRAGKAGRIFSFHTCDWRNPTRDILRDRALMGEGCANIREIRGWVEEAGFSGFVEVEIFSDELWAIDQDEYLERIKKAYLAYS